MAGLGAIESKIMAGVSLTGCSFLQPGANVPIAATAIQVIKIIYFGGFKMWVIVLVLKIEIKIIPTLIDVDFIVNQFVAATGKGMDIIEGSYKIWVRQAFVLNFKPIFYITSGLDKY
jgi:hypothetical protein